MYWCLETKKFNGITQLACKAKIRAQKAFTELAHICKVCHQIHKEGCSPFG